MNGFPESGLNFSYSRFIDNPIADEVFKSRYSKAEFRKRPFVLEFQRFSYNILGIPYQLSFNLINIIFLVAFFYQAARISFYRTDGSQQELIQQLLFLSSLPVLFCYFGSIFTYDDIVQYYFIALFLQHFFTGNRMSSFIYFIIACLVRETSFIFYILIIAHFIMNSETNWKKWWIWFLPPVVYGLFVAWYLPEDLVQPGKAYFLDKRFAHLGRNFQTPLVARETITIVLFMTIPYLHLLVIKYKNSNLKKVKQWCVALSITIVINLALVLVSALVRESRLLFLPLIAVIPFLVNELKKVVTVFVKRINFWAYVVSAIFALILSLIFYTPATIGTGYLFKLYLTIFFLLYFYWVLTSRCNFLRS